MHPTRDFVTARPPQGLSAMLLRALALSCLALFAGQLVLPVVHNLVARHRLCTQHGDWIHVEDEAGTFREVGRTHGYRPGEPRHQHDHCGLTAAVRHDPGQATARAPVESAGPSFGPAILLVVSSVFEAPGDDRYFFAPKHGPPHRA